VRSRRFSPKMSLKMWSPARRDLFRMRFSQPFLQNAQSRASRQFYLLSNPHVTTYALRHSQHLALPSKQNRSWPGRVEFVGSCKS